MAKLGTYPAASVLDGTEELIAVQSSTSVKVTSDNIKGYIYNSVYKNSGYTAVSGDRIFADSQSPAFTITLPITPVNTNSVSIIDCGNNANTNNITIDRNGETINGLAEDLVINVDNARVDLIFNGTTWEYNVITVGGLNQSQVDARVSAVGITENWQDQTEVDARVSAVGITENWQDQTQVDARVVVKASGKQLKYFCVSQGDFRPWTTGMAKATQVISANNTAPYDYIAFDGGTQEIVAVSWKTPKSWNAGTIRGRFIWVDSVVGTSQVNWGFQSLSYGDGELLSLGVGAGGACNDVGQSSVAKLLISPWSSTYTITGSPVAGDLVDFVLYRDGAGDSHNSDARLLGWELEYTTNVPTDD